MIFTRSHWKSWLVRGAYIIGGYSAVLGFICSPLFWVEWICNRPCCGSGCRWP